MTYLKPFIEMLMTQSEKELACVTNQFLKA